MRPTSRYEIFRKPPSAEPRWVETAKTLEDAKYRVKDLSTMFPGSHFILDTQNSCFIVPQDVVCGHSRASDSEVPKSISKRSPQE